jgi:cytidine deaminase
MAEHTDPAGYEDLCAEARQAARNAYAEYSGFRVGAAVRGRQRTYVGANVENASYGLTLCAERAALAAAIAQGDRDIDAIAVACIDAGPSRPIEELVPCGTCRQWIAELAPGARVVICGTGRLFTLDQLLPTAFRLALDSPRP